MSASSPDLPAGFDVRPGYDIAATIPCLLPPQPTINAEISRRGCSLQVPFAGTETMGTCLDGNTATDGLAPRNQNVLPLEFHATVGSTFFGLSQHSTWLIGSIGSKQRLSCSAQVWTPPVCTIDTCADPPDGGGYQKVENVWE